MALRARIGSADVSENIVNQNAHIAAKLVSQPIEIKTNRAALGDIGNVKGSNRHASVSTDQPTKEFLNKNAPGLARQKQSQCVKENIKIPALPTIRPDVEPMDALSLEHEIEDIDKEDEGNPQLVVEYVQEIYHYLRQVEKEQSIPHDYLNGQQVVKPQMRALLIDWLIGVHLQFKLLPETVYTSVAILDRFMSEELTDISRKNLQLVGVTAMFVASKYEEIYAPEVKDFVYITDKAYADKEILRMELRVLEALRFNLGRPLPLHFLRRASKAGGVEVITHTLAKYIMELSLVDYSLVAEPPSRLAAAALALASRILEPNATCFDDVWGTTLEYYTRYTVPEMTETIVKLAKVLVDAPKAKLTTVYNKYSNRKFMKIARIPALDDPLVQDIADGNL